MRGDEPTMADVSVFQSRALCAGRPQITRMDASSIIQIATVLLRENGGDFIMWNKQGA